MVGRVEEKSRIRKRRDEGHDCDHAGILKDATDDDQQEIGEKKVCLGLAVHH